MHVCVLKEAITQGDNAPTRAMDNLTKTQMPGMGNPLLLLTGVQETPQTVLAIVIALGLPPESKTILLKIPHTSDASLRRTELELTCKPPP